MGNKKHFSRTAAAMSLRQKQRNAVMKPMEDDRPKNFSEVMPRGPLAVKNTVVGMLKENGDGGIVVPDPSFKETNFGLVNIDRNNMNGAPYNMVVVAEVLNPSATDGNYRGKITEVLGDIGNNDVKMLTVMHQFGLSRTFPDFVMDEVKDLPVSPSDEEIEYEDDTSDEKPQESNKE